MPDLQFFFPRTWADRRRAYKVLGSAFDLHEQSETPNMNRDWIPSQGDTRQSLETSIEPAEQHVHRSQKDLKQLSWDGHRSYWIKFRASGVGLFQINLRWCPTYSKGSKRPEADLAREDRHLNGPRSPNGGPWRGSRKNKLKNTWGDSQGADQSYVEMRHDDPKRF